MSRFTEEQWLDIFRQCKASGMSDFQWCRQNHIASSTFYYHLKRIRNKASEPVTVMETEVRHPEYHEVVPLIVYDEDTSPKQPEEVTKPSIRISVGDIRLDVFRDADHTIIAETLMAVKSICQVKFQALPKYILLPDLLTCAKA